MKKNELSYFDIMKIDHDEYHSCNFHWDCENCYKNLCLTIVGVADFPSVYGHFHIISFKNNKDKKDHIAVIKGDVYKKEDVLIRIHSSCLTGDALGSLRCDCGPQLRESFSLIEKEGLGVIIYMQQEGRGIGLANKIKAYMLQDNGLDTYDANLHLGYESDERDYELSAAIIRKFEIKNIRLITNNPNKIKEMEKFGIKVKKRVPIETPVTDYDRKYMITKKQRFGHLLSLEK